jgi:hypothetical protein
MDYKLGKNTLKNIDSIKQSGKPESHKLAEAAKYFINYTPIDFCVIANGGYRTAEEQKVLYDRGVSRCDGYLQKSEHQNGLALDIVPWVNGKATWETKHAFYLSGAFMAFCEQMELDITSGADWNRDGELKDDSWDPCHFQIREKE